MRKVNIKKNDEILVIKGRDRGSKGRVLRVLPGTRSAVVERINMIKRHTRPNPQKQIRGHDPALQRQAGVPGMRQADAGRAQAPRGRQRRAGLQAV